MADPTIEEDLDELEAYFKKGPAVSRAACGRMVTTFRLLQGRFRRQLEESRDRERSLREELALSDAVLEMQKKILDAVVLALKGPEPPMGLHDRSDLGALAARLVAERDVLVKVVTAQRDACAQTTEALRTVAAGTDRLTTGFKTPLRDVLLELADGIDPSVVRSSHDHG